MITGTIDGDAVRIRSAYGEQHGDALSFTFTGKVTGDADVGHARHGRVPAGDVDGDTPRRPEWLMMGVHAAAIVAGDRVLGAGAVRCCRLSRAAAAPGRAASPKYDLLLRGGHVIDAQQRISAVRDVAIAGGRSPPSRPASTRPTRSRPSTCPACT